MNFRSFYRSDGALYKQGKKFSFRGKKSFEVVLSWVWAVGWLFGGAEGGRLSAEKMVGWGFRGGGGEGGRRIKVVGGGGFCGTIVGVCVQFYIHKTATLGGVYPTFLGLFLASQFQMWASCLF